MSNLKTDGEVAPTLRAMGHANSHANGGGQMAVAFHANAQACQLPGPSRDTSISDSLTRSQQAAVALPVYGTDCYNGAITGDVAATLGTPGSSVNASGPTVMQPVGVFQDSEFGVQQYDSAGTLRAGRIPEHQMVMQPVAFTRCDNGQDAQVDVTPTMRCGSNYSAHLAVAQLVPDVAPTLDQRAGRSGENSFATSGGLVPVAQPIPIHDQATRHAGKRGEHSDGKGNGLGVGQPGDPAPTLTKGDKHAVAVAFHENQRGELTVNDTAGALKVGGGKPGQGYPAVAFAPDLHPTMVARSSRGGGQTNSPGHNADETLVAFASATEFLPQSSRVYSEAEAAPTLQAAGARMGNRAPQVHAAMQVRRLTPVECERLQGFPDNYTNIPWRKKPEAPDGPRYKSLGNSMAVPCMAWIGRRIDEVETLARGGGA